MTTLSIVAAVGVWHELELALKGENGFGGDVAEIYGYRLVPNQANDAQVAGRNLTGLLRHFVDLHDGVEIAIDTPDGWKPIDPFKEEVPPFDHRLHVRVSSWKHGRQELATELQALLQRTIEDAVKLRLPRAEYAEWLEVTRHLIGALEKSP